MYEFNTDEILGLNSICGPNIDNIRILGFGSDKNEEFKPDLATTPSGGTFEAEGIDYNHLSDSQIVAIQEALNRGASKEKIEAQLRKDGYNVTI